MRESTPPPGGAGREAGVLASATGVAVLGWIVGIAINLAAVGLAILLVQRTTPATVALTAVGLVLLAGGAIALSIWVSLAFGRRVRGMVPRA